MQPAGAPGPPTSSRDVGRNRCLTCHPVNKSSGNKSLLIRQRLRSSRMGFIRFRCIITDSPERVPLVAGNTEHTHLAEAKNSVHLLAHPHPPFFSLTLMDHRPLLLPTRITLFLRPCGVVTSSHLSSKTTLSSSLYVSLSGTRPPGS